MKWTKDELRNIGDTDDLHISPFRDDGKTYGTPTWIWSVVVGEGVYVRAYNGKKSRWYKSAVKQKAGRIRAAGKTHEVRFEPVHGALIDDIDEAYKLKYKRSKFLPPMIAEGPRAATIKIIKEG